jgi:threonine dehydrogenase-like Zn-dependent dehydrogenase
MKALVYTEPGRIVYREEPDPVPEAGEALIRVEAVGICGSDLHAYLGHDERRPPPLILGHEVSGRALSGEREGQRVVLNPLVTCGRCDHCLGGRSNLCGQRQIIGMPPRQGAYAELVKIPEANVIPLPEQFDPVKAALAEPAATALHAIGVAERALWRPLAEVRALVLGAGAVGISAALALQSRGVGEVALAETNPLRRQTAQSAGGLAVYDPLDDAGPEAESCDLVIDAVGGGETRKAASRAVKPGGVIAHIGLMDTGAGLDVRKLTLQEVTLVGIYTYAMVDFRATVKALHSGVLGALDWVETRPLGDGARAFADLEEGRAAAAKIVLRPDDPG